MVLRSGTPFPPPSLETIVDACVGKTYNVLWATMEQYLRQGMKPDSKVLDIRQVDVSTGRFLEDNTPVFVITFTTQEVLLFRDRKSGEVVVGAEDRVEQCNYAAVVTRVEEDLENELTGGWKVIEVRLSFCTNKCAIGDGD